MRTPLLLGLAVMCPATSLCRLEHIPPAADGGRIAGQRKEVLGRREAVDRAMMDKNMR